MHRQCAGPSGLVFQSAGVLELWVYKTLSISSTKLLGITIINNLGEMINFQPYIKCQVGIISHLSEPTDRGSSNLKHGYSATSSAWYPPHLKVYVGMNASSAWIQQASRVALVSSICCKRMLNVHTTTKEEIQLQAGK